MRRGVKVKVGENPIKFCKLGGFLKKKILFYSFQLHYGVLREQSNCSTKVSLQRDF